MLGRRERQKLPGGWKSKIKGLRKVIERELGPELQDESSSRRELREKLFELSLVIYSIRGLEYWNTRLPSLLRAVTELVDIELTDRPSWAQELSDIAMDLQSYGRKQVCLVLTS
jgi:hypothetical protein